MMELIVVAGMSGAGKTSAAEALEDIGYSVMDGLPLPLLRTLVPECLNKGGVYERLAAVADLRSCESYSELTDTVKAMKAEYSGKVRVRLLCMEAAADVIMKRFRLQRRLHPLQNRFEGDLAAAIAYEQTHLQPIRGAADHLVDTSQISVGELKEQIRELFVPRTADALTVLVMSFGFKHGEPLGTDIVFDMRCLPNPFYVPELKEHDGTEACVQDFVMDAPESQEYFERVLGLLRFLIPLYIRSGRPQLAVGFGCTGGQHRSVTFAERVSEALRSDGLYVISHHRDLKRG